MKHENKCRTCEHNAAIGWPNNPPLCTKSKMKIEGVVFACEDYKRTGETK